MRGRQIEALLRPVTVVGVFVMQCLPRFVRGWTFDFVSLAPGLPGVWMRYVVAKSLLKHSGNNLYIGRFCTIKHWDKPVVW